MNFASKVLFRKKQGFFTIVFPWWYLRSFGVFITYLAWYILNSIFIKTIYLTSKWTFRFIYIHLIRIRNISITYDLINFFGTCMKFCCYCVKNLMVELFAIVILNVECMCVMCPRAGFIFIILHWLQFSTINFRFSKTKS